ncbi:MAG: NADPH-dependent oxidoreductase [Phenylobacterium sp.]|uniref:NADPH-dependent FMN reductase n=1 Tax=Phenylobacterium sp. TaxID=1871053 RepID=UPI00120EAE46|nr:NADPH-dependent FMN reductase [Phenylobacterium sp.]TAJ71157.1 MAG: NADPH-dependent oxidoreductase [Phenylobacterium sp.]
MSRKPLIVGLGGTIRAGSSTEKALVCALRHAEGLGAETRLLGGEFLGGLPIFDPRPGDSTAGQIELAEAIRSADGVIVASPGYHGSISGVIKNALDTLELTRSDPSPYLTAKPVGTIITADGWQAAGTTLMALRAIIHALRGWPTPFGAALNAGTGLFDEAGDCKDQKDAWQLATVAEQVVEFAQMKARR